MLAAAVLLLVGLTLTIRWCRTAYRPWGSAAPHADSAEEIAEEPTSATPSSLQLTTLRYLRGVAVGLVGGFWAGALVTGPAGRLIMRLLAVTAGEDAQGKITEAEEVVGRIDLAGSLALYILGGILPGLLNGVIYVVIRRWLPGGILGGMTFGALHLVLAATRVDPLRPDNPDFDIVGPGWLAVATFGLAAIVHGMAVAAIANRYTRPFGLMRGVGGNDLRSSSRFFLRSSFLSLGSSSLSPSCWVSSSRWPCHGLMRSCERFAAAWHSLPGGSFSSASRSSRCRPLSPTWPTSFFARTLPP